MGLRDSNGYLATITKIDVRKGSTVQTNKVGFTKTYFVYDIDIPKIGERYNIGNMLTSTVTAVDLPIFSTSNSIYTLEWLPYTETTHTGSVMTFWIPSDENHNVFLLHNEMFYAPCAIGPFDFLTPSICEEFLTDLKSTLFLIKSLQLDITAQQLSLIEDFFEQHPNGIIVYE